MSYQIDHLREFFLKDEAGWMHPYTFDTRSKCRKCGAEVLAGEEKDHARREHLITDAYQRQETACAS